MAKVDTRHLEFNANATRWQMCRDVLEGEDRVHDRAEAYLPRLKNQDPGDYASYVKRAPFYNATARTVDGFVGMIFRKEPVVEAPASLDELRADMTLTECKLPELAEILTREVIGLGRVGVLVEFPQVAEGPMTLASAAAMNLRPYATTYRAENIINWRTERVNNALQLVMLALAETVTEWTSAFEAKQVPQVRALLLDDGRYVQQIWRLVEGQDWQQVGQDIVPLMNGAPIDSIPFVLFGPTSNGAAVQKPPILDLVTLNLSHYRSTADLEHGAHFTGLPTAVVSGYSAAKDEKLAIGGSTAWVFPDPSAKATYLEFTGQGLQALADRCKAKEQGMAAIGARMLAPEKEGVEAAQTIKLRHSGESAVLSTIANMVSAGLTRVLEIMAQWEGVDAEVLVTLNTDFVDTGLSAQNLTALVAAWQQGAISEQTLFENLQWGEIIAEDRSFEEEQAAIASAGPTLQQQAALIVPEQKPPARAAA